MIEVGRVCVKTAGREAGKYCVVVKKMDENFVMVTGPKELTSVKRRRCNVDHLEPLMEELSIKSDAPDNEVLKAYQKANLVTKLGIGGEKPKPAKKAEPKKAEKKEKPRETKPAKKPAAKKKVAKKAPAKKSAKKKAK